MPFFRALGYFFEEAFTSLWRGRLINALSVATIAVSLFVTGAFLAVAGGLNQVVTRWTDRVQVIFYLEDGLEDRIRQSLADRLGDDPAVERLAYVSRAEALERFRALFTNLRNLPDDLGENPFPASIEVTVKAAHQSPQEVRRLVQSFEHAPGVEEVQYDLLWIERLATVVRLVRGVGGFLGGILVLAGVFTISNVIRLTVFARQDELDIMRLVGATRAYVKGPFVVEGMIQGGLGGALAVALLSAVAQLVTREASMATEFLGPTAVLVPTWLNLAIVAGGMTVGVVGSLVSLGRSKV